MISIPKKMSEKFQSAPPVKGATAETICLSVRQGVSIRAPREGGDSAICIDTGGTGVSIRAPREGGDLVWGGVASCNWVSIRAPREGGDRMAVNTIGLIASFNPRPP